MKKIWFMLKSGELMCVMFETDGNAESVWDQIYEDFGKQGAVVFDIGTGIVAVKYEAVETWGVVDDASPDMYPPESD